MILVLKREADRAVAEELMARIEETGCRPLYLPGDERTVLGALGDERLLESLMLQNHPMVESVQRILAPYKAVSREMQPNDTVVDVGPARFGGDAPFSVIAGPCAIESEEQFSETCRAVRASGASALRGGAFKPRTSPYSFQGHGKEGLEILQRVSEDVGLPAFTEVVEVADVELVEQYADGFQVGARNMQNFRLLRALGERRKPVLLKRGMAATLDDLLLAAEYIVSSGNSRVILCERGIKTFETAMRNTLDLAAVPYVKERSHLPIVVDPSHGTGLRELVPPMALAAAACGADGLLVEVHREPEKAWSDGRQSLTPEAFTDLMDRLPAVLAAVGRKAAACPA
ncbi:MAG: 3-deoxy-7-phosphoheptulonate synthase [Planctomycetota bacterium]|nr:3-deoxy-7-phosphoheptulonate synthase [Planctomycetota bacterium]